MEIHGVDSVTGSAAAREPLPLDELRSLADFAAEQAASENFPVAPRWLPRSARDDLGRVYAYARFVDDVGDRASGDRQRLLDLIEDQVRAVHQGRDVAACGPVAQLQPLLVDNRLPVEPLLELIAANRLDQARTEYDTFDDLLRYCRLSAAPIGRLVLHLAGAATAANVTASDAVCAALQVVEHCQDVAEDARAGRVYLPLADRARFAVAPEELVAPSASPGLRAVVATQVDRARQLLDCGRPLVSRLSGWPRLAVAGYVAGGWATADAIERVGFDVLSGPTKPRRRTLLGHALRVLVERR